MKSINIVIKDENKDRIEEVLGGIQKHCRERCVNYETIKTAAEMESKRFKSRGISRENRNGSTIAFTEGADVFPSAYKGTPYGTYYKIKFTKTGANLVDVDRIPCNAKHLKRIVELSKSAKRALIKAY